MTLSGASSKRIPAPPSAANVLRSFTARESHHHRHFRQKPRCGSPRFTRQTQKSCTVKQWRCISCIMHDPRAFLHGRSHISPRAEMSALRMRLLHAPCPGVSACCGSRRVPQGARAWMVSIDSRQMVALQRNQNLPRYWRGHEAHCHSRLVERNAHSNRPASCTTSFPRQPVQQLAETAQEARALAEMVPCGPALALRRLCLNLWPAHRASAFPAVRHSARCLISTLTCVLPHHELVITVGSHHSTHAAHPLSANVPALKRSLTFAAPVCGVTKVRLTPTPNRCSLPTQIRSLVICRVGVFAGL